MQIDYPTTDVPATPEYVLAVLQDLSRYKNPKLQLTDATTIAEWRDACDLSDWQGLSQGMNEGWDIQCDESQWRAVLEPADQRRLSDVCNLIAHHAMRPTIRPLTLAGSTSTAAGAFLTIRSFMHGAGVPVDEIAPSTPLSPYFRLCVSKLTTMLLRLAPGTLPKVEVQYRWYKNANRGYLVGLLIVVLGMIVGSSVLAYLGGFYCLVINWYIAEVGVLPSTVTLGELVTFRDLAMAISQAKSV